MENENFSTQESFDVIAKMISQAKNEYSCNGEGWLLWGWLLFLASASSAILSQMDQGKYIPWIWDAMGIIVVLYFIYGLISKKIKKVKTYVEEMLNKFAIGFFLSLIATIIATSIKGDSFAFGYFFILYAFWMFINGSAIRFKPLIIGAFINWAAAISIFIIKDFKSAMIISAVAIAAGYLIPGYMLRNQNKKITKA
jgi:hypothetical protein